MSSLIKRKTRKVTINCEIQLIRQSEITLFLYSIVIFVTFYFAFYPFFLPLNDTI